VVELRIELISIIVLLAVMEEAASLESILGKPIHCKEIEDYKLENSYFQNQIF